MKKQINKIIWKTLKILMQLLLVIILIVFLARINYLPVLVPDSWKEWIIDVTDKWLDRRGMGKVSQAFQNIISLEFLDRNISQNETLIRNQKTNFIKLLKETNNHLNQIAGSYEVLLSLSNNDIEFNQIRAQSFLRTVLNNIPDYDGFLIWDLKQKKFTVKVKDDNYNLNEDVYLKLANKLDYKKIAQQSTPVLFYRDGHLVLVYAFKGDTLEQKGIIFSILSTNFFKRDLSVLRGKKFFNYAFFNKRIAYLKTNPQDSNSESVIRAYASSKKLNEYFDGQRSIMPKIGYRITAESFVIKNSLFPNERININIGIIYPKSVLISIFLNLFLLILLTFGIIIIVKMYKHLKESYQSYRRLKEAPMLLLDDTLDKMSKVFENIVTSTKRIKSNYERQQVVTEKFLEIAPRKAIGYEDKKEEKTESYGFVTEDTETSEIEKPSNEENNTSS